MATAKKDNKLTDNQEKKQMPFNRDNYKWVLIGLAVLLLGFILMIGGGSDNPDVFNEGMFNFRRLTLAPILILAGFGIEFYAIMKK
ncbi:MAG: DUF3098 domain-containing protein [Bacteroidia bacterium]|nr:DUF3098 domain-containing protein [Bacteroidales bacterium]MDO5342279.1 DUF3098 domain-containing protein [Bacteroidia bacterium]